MIPAGYKYAECRGMLRHAWHEVPSDWTNNMGPSEGVPFTVKCERCDMERRDILGTNTGEVVSRRYIQPVGYHIDSADPDERPTIVDFRLDWIERNVAAVKEAKRAEQRRGVS